MACCCTDWATPGQGGLHYIAINLAGSFVFLIGVSLIYGVTGTLNMADLAARVPGLADGDRFCSKPARRSWAWRFCSRRGHGR